MATINGLRLYPEGAISAIADAIRAKNGGTSTYKVSEMARAISAIPSQDNKLKGLADRTLSGVLVAPSSVTYIGEYAFSSCLLTSVSFPACISVDNYAFYNCSRMEVLSLPVCKTVGIHAFRECWALVSVYLPECTSIGSYTFYGDHHLTEAILPKCVEAPQYLFRGCSALSSVNLPVCTSVSSYTFAYCSSLTTLSLPKCKSINGTYAFRYCGNTFKSLYLLGSTLCVLSNSNAFYSTNTLSIYVPQSLFNSYIVATNWANISSRIMSV